MSDWGATHSMSIAAGLDVEQPGSARAPLALSSVHVMQGPLLECS